MLNDLRAELQRIGFLSERWSTPDRVVTVDGWSFSVMPHGTILVTWGAPQYDAEPPETHRVQSECYLEAMTEIRNVAVFSRLDTQAYVATRRAVERVFDEWVAW